MRFVFHIEEPIVVTRVLGHLGLPTEAPCRLPSCAVSLAPKSLACNFAGCRCGAKLCVNGPFLFGLYFFGTQGFFVRKS